MIWLRIWKAEATRESLQRGLVSPRQLLEAREAITGYDPSRKQAGPQHDSPSAVSTRT